MKSRQQLLTFRRRIRTLRNLVLLSFLILTLRLAYIIFWWYPYDQWKRNPPFPTDSGIVYEVQSGDYLFAISQRYEVPLKSIIRLNDIKNPNLIHPGDKIRIPNPPPEYPYEEIIVALQSPAHFIEGVKTVWERHVQPKVQAVQAHAADSQSSE